MAIAKTISAELQKVPTWAKNTVLVLGSSLLLGLFAHVAIHLPFTPVPIATQGTIALLLSVLLGSKRAPLAVAAFLGQGAMGLPVFANATAGLAVLTGPTAGYLWGYFVAAYVVGKLTELWQERSVTKAFLAMAVGNAMIFALGAAWLSTFVGLSNAFWLGVVPFLIGDLVKLIACAKILHWLGWAKRAETIREI